MASYNELLALIDAYINQNGVQAITGQVLNGVLRAMVDQLGRGYSIMGAADPTTDPGTPDGPETWFASVPGTYTNFDGLQIVDGELALLSYVPSTGFSKNTIYEGFQTVQATIDGNVGTPAVGVSYANGILSFDFRNMKGNPGNDGAPAGFGNVSATVDSNVGTPGVTVQASGPDTAKNFVFNFTNLKGETGVTSVLATVDNTSGNPQCAVSLNGQQLVLNFTGLKGAQGDTGSSVAYPFTIVNNLTTNDATQALSAAMGVQLESEVSQLEHKVSGATTDVTGYTKIDGGINNDGEVKTAWAAWHSSPIRLLQGETIHLVTALQGMGAAIAITDENGSSYTAVVASSSAKDYTYTATQDTYVSITYLKNGSDYREVTTLVKTSTGMDYDIAQLQNKVAQNEQDIEDLNEDVHPVVKDIVLGTDYSVLDGGIDHEGIPSESTSFWHSSPIAVKRGDVVHLVVAVDGSGRMAIAKTDATETYFRVLQAHNATKDYTVKINFDGYICIGYNWQTYNTIPRVPTTFTITTSNISEAEGNADEYADGNLIIGTELNETPVLSSLARRIESETKSAIARARFERGKMLSEIANMTAEDILAQGSCGYSESGGVVTDGTITWKIYKGGILHISGYGKFYDFVKGTSCCRTISEVNNYVSLLGESLWFYGFIVQNVNGIVPPFSADKQKFNGDAIAYSGKRYVPFGDNTNPLNNLPYGYAAPWYIYRDEYDWEYASPATYATQNPHGIKYNRICIEEDLDNGGITYLGDWTFYRATADSLILPTKLTKIGTFGVRYSPCIDTVVMGDLITEIEDHGCSRMEALRHLHLSDTLQSVGEGGFQLDEVIEKVSFPSSLSSLGITMFEGDACLQSIGLGSVTGIPLGLATNDPVIEVEIPAGVTTIGDTAFYRTNITKITIPSSVSSIGATSFSKCYNLKVVVYETTNIALDANAVFANPQAGYLFGYCDWVLIPSANTVNSYFYKYFDLVKDDGVYKYFKRWLEKANN